MYNLLKKRDNNREDEEEDMDITGGDMTSPSKTPSTTTTPFSPTTSKGALTITTPSVVNTGGGASLLTAELRQQQQQSSSSSTTTTSTTTTATTTTAQQQQPSPHSSIASSSAFASRPRSLSSSPIISAIPTGTNFSQVPTTAVSALSSSLKDRGSPLYRNSYEAKVQVIPTSSPFSPKPHNKNLPPLHTIDIKQELLDPIIQFYESRTNYDCMPNSCKVMVFDIDLPVREAFYVAASNDISFATLWDSKTSSLVGMLTVTDLIDILLHYHGETNVIQDLIAQKEIRYWRQLQKRNRPAQLVHVTPEDSLLTAIYALQKHKIHRLPVVSPRGSLLQIITHSHLLAFLVQNMNFDSPIFKYSIEALGIGTYDTLITASPSIALFDALKMFAKFKVSAIPVVDDQGVVVDVFSRYDIVYLVRDGDYKLEYSLEEALKRRPKIPVFTCTKNESFEKVLRHLSSTRIHRLICVDDDGRAVGIVSISDIFSFLLFNDERTLPEIKEKIQRGPQVNHAYMSNLFMEAQHPLDRPGL